METIMKIIKQYIQYLTEKFFSKKIIIATDEHHLKKIIEKEIKRN
jgi:hypothetical protein